MNKVTDLALAVVIPVFNTEAYLKQCLDSILAQSFRNFIIYAVDDGSTDNSLSILESYAKRDSRIKVIRKENGGVSSARNIALDHIESDRICNWVTYIDSDDVISPDYFLNFYKIAVKNIEIEYICTSAIYFNNQGDFPLTYHFPEETILNKDQCFEHYFSDAAKQEIDPTIHLFIGNRFFKVKLIEGLRFPENVHCGEDQIFMIHALNNIKKYGALSPRSIYKYRMRSSSLTHTLGKQADTNFNLYSRIYFAQKNIIPNQIMQKVYEKLIVYWWGLVKYSVLNNKLEKQQQLKSVYSQIISDKHYQKLKFIYRLGDTAVRLYLKYISKQQKTKPPVEESLFK
ncbi:glycosyltransferase family 2 protein [uncultured Sutterella sp.]|uniref:glycosyltransferase family 2 protein n=1 Tax=uncultured Sutterella sp. TaxID=286133 RepID=UPI00263304C9|nr:glycosyltransferase family 2 protein [uncultured Sutterella sp.]